MIDLLLLFNRAEQPQGATKAQQAQIGQRHVAFNRHELHHAFTLAILRYQGDAALQPLLKGALIQAFTIQIDGARLAAHHPYQAFKQLRTPRAEQAIDADDFPFA